MDVLASMGNAEVTNGQEVAMHMHELLELVVIEWDVKDEAGEPLAVSMDGFKKLPSDLLLFLVNEAQKAINKVPLLPSGDLPNSALQTGKAGKRRKAT